MLSRYLHFWVLENYVSSLFLLSIYYQIILIVNTLQTISKILKKKIMMIVGACIFLVAAAQALPLFFGL